MLVTDDGMARLANELHLSKAWSPMRVTDDGIVTRVTFVLSTPHSFHESKTSPSSRQFGCVMVVVPSGIAKCNPSWPSDGSAVADAADSAAAAAILNHPEVTN